MNDQQTESAWPHLAGAEFMILTTHRRDGSPVDTTVWFAQVGERLYVTTYSGAGKAKRLRGRDHVVVAPSTQIGEVLGQATPGRGRILEAEEFPAAIAALRAKYNPAYDQMTSGGPRGSEMGERTFFEIWPDTGAAE